MSDSSIVIRGAREHNLKNVDVEIPRDKLVVITGLSGSGKSSLAFDTIYAEGQRRYVESLSSYARQFLGQMDKPDLDSIDGLSPAVSIDQKTTSKNPRSTVGTVTEIYDYLRLLFARIGTPHCPECGREIERQTTDQVADKILEQGMGRRAFMLAPVVTDRKGEFAKLLEDLRGEGFSRVRIDGEVRSLDDPIELDKKFRHTIEVVVDRIVIREGSTGRIAEAVEQATALAHGRVGVYLLPDRADKLLTRHRAQRHLEQLERIVRDIAQRSADAADDLPVEIGIRPLRNQDGGAVPRRGRGLFAAVSQLFRCTEHFFAHDCIDVRSAVQDTVHRAARYARKLRHLLHCYCHLLTLLPSIRRQNRLELSSLRRCKSLLRLNRNHYTRKCFFRQESPCTTHNHAFASVPSVPSHSAQNQSHFLGRITMLRSGY